MEPAMAGHSQFKNIMHRKGRVDAVRSKVFSKLAREITVSAKLAETGAVSFMFDRVGAVEFDPEAADADAMLEAAIEAGAEDVVSSEDGHEVYCEQGSLAEVSKALEARFGEPRKSALVWRAQSTVPVDDEAGEKLVRLVETLEDQDDVQNVFVNFEVSDAVAARLG